MKKRMESDLLLKIISVVFAFLLWMFVINTDNPVIKKTFSDVPVDMLNEQVLDDLNQTYKIESGDTVSFTVKGKKDVVDRLTKSDFRATADVSSMSDVHAIQIEVEALRYKSQLDIDTGGATVKVVLEDVKSDQIPVNVVVKGTPASGYGKHADSNAESDLCIWAKECGKQDQTDCSESRCIRIEERCNNDSEYQVL